MGRVFALKLTRVQRDVLQAICDHARDDGTGAFPSVGLLAWKCDLSERQIKRVLRQLEGKDEVFKDRLIERIGYLMGGRGRTPEYRIDLDAGTLKQPYQARVKGDTQLSPFTRKKGDNLTAQTVTTHTQKGDTSNKKGDIQASPDPSGNRFKPSVNLPVRDQHTFEEADEIVCAMIEVHNVDPLTVIAELNVAEDVRTGLVSKHKEVPATGEPR